MALEGGVSFGFAPDGKTQTKVPATKQALQVSQHHARRPNLRASSKYLEPCAKCLKCLERKNHFAAPATPRKASPPILPKTGMQLKTALDHSTHPTSCSIQYRFIRTKTSPQSKKPIAVSAAKSNHFVTFNTSAT
jgi:hypothetical protein